MDRVTLLVIVQILLAAQTLAQDKKECSTAADVMFVLDSSGSIRDNNIKGSRDNWELMLEFVANIIGGLDLTRVRVGLITFSTNASIEIPLGKITDRERLMAEVQRTWYWGADTNTAAGLRLMATQQFGTAADRPDIPNVAVVITDGVSTINNHTTLPEARRARAKGIIIYTIGISDNIQEEELRGISSPPQQENENYWRQANFQALNQIVDIVSSGICQSLETTTQSTVKTTPPSTKSPTSTQPEPVCTTPADVVFVLDSSESIRQSNINGSRDNWELMLGFVADIIRGLDLSRMRVGLVIFAENADNEIMLGMIRDQQQLIDKVMKASYRSGPTHTAAGLRVMATEQFGSEGDRPGAPNVAVVITDGDSNVNSNLTLPEAQRARDKGIQIYTIGISKYIQEEELRGISSPPQQENENYWRQANFQTLSQIVDIVSFGICQPSVTTTEAQIRSTTTHTITTTTSPTTTSSQSTTTSSRSTTTSSNPIIISKSTTTSSKSTTTNQSRVTSSKPTTTTKSTTTSSQSTTTSSKSTTTITKPTTSSKSTTTSSQPTTMTSKLSTPELECGSVLDLVLLVDASTSVAGEWQVLLSFLQSVLDSLDISMATVQVGAVLFSRDAHVAFYLDKYSHKEELKAQVREWLPIEGATNIAGALQRMRTEMFTQEHGDRPWAPNLCLAVTDGRAVLRQEDILTQAQLAKDAGITMVTVGITERADAQVLTAMATRPALAVGVQDVRHLATKVEDIYTLLCSSSTPGIATACSTPLDIGFVVDTSGSIKEDGDYWPAIINFLKNVTARWPVGNRGVRVGAVVFSDVARLMFSLARYSTNSDVTAALDRLLYLGGTTNLAAGLRVARTSLFHGPGARDYAPDVAVVLMDGMPNAETDHTLQEARALVQDRVNLVVVGVTQRVSENPLQAVVGDQFLRIDSFDDLDFHVTDLAKATCSVRGQGQSGTDIGTEHPVDPGPAYEDDCDNQPCAPSQRCPTTQLREAVRVCSCANRLDTKFCFAQMPQPDSDFSLPELSKLCFYNKDSPGETLLEAPQVRVVCPTYGPLGGGSDVIVWGSQLDSPVLYVTLGEVPCQLLFRNATYLHCLTGNGTGLVRQGESQDMVLDYMFRGLSAQVVVEDVFTFKPNPVIEDIYPLESFIDGGLTITVKGRHLDSAAKTIIEVTLNYLTLQVQDTLASICDTLNSATILCKTPKVTLRPEYETGGRMRRALRDLADTRVRMRRQTADDTRLPLNSEDLEIKLKVKVGPVRAERDFQEFANPRIHTFPEQDLVRVFLPGWPTHDTHIRITGERLHNGAQADDYMVYVGDEECSVQDLTSHTLLCIPPQVQPRVRRNTSTYQGLPGARVRVGDITIFLGYVRYGSGWDDPGLRRVVYICLGVGVPLLILGIVVSCCWCRRRKPRDGATAAKGKNKKQYIPDDGDYMRPELNQDTGARVKA